MNFGENLLRNIQEFQEFMCLNDRLSATSNKMTEYRAEPTKGRFERLTCM